MYIYIKKEKTRILSIYNCESNLVFFHVKNDNKEWQWAMKFTEISRITRKYIKNIFPQVICNVQLILKKKISRFI